MKDALQEGTQMIEMEARVVGIFVDRACPERWIVRDGAGNFWMVPPVENPWDNRQPFYPTPNTELEPVPGHYKYLLGLPQ
jgi:hypothetical protein